ncbi:FKBP-type peptidyl-prolyl cis-trans isomerase [Pleomorphochaeta sp. DL1XJH-081]|jgi:FKBP-type peptidyl-prolyl cis-trans isomerase|uniref:FKBP-type peptidyl-prolyl cis-trans isomerase n=1 Tax=Pleomorphochaeta sp. DL1XJH-081 TaxID=3409690 RepID=UPI003BB510EF
MVEWLQRKIPRQIIPLVIIALVSTQLISCTPEDLGQMQSTGTQSVQEDPEPSPQETAIAGDVDEVSETESSASPIQQSMVEYLPEPETLDERFSYTYGYLLMVTAMRDVQGLDPVYFARGAYDAGLAETPLIEESEMNTVLYEYQDKLITEAARRLEELASKNLEDAESFLAVNGKREGVTTTSSGLQYEILESSEGVHPEADDTVKVNYRLTYLDGREGDASIRGIPSTFDLSSMIPGFREGLLLMPVGSSFRFYVHPDLGYGEEGSTRIEPNTLLIFDVELVEIVE